MSDPDDTRMAPIESKGVAHSNLEKTRDLNTDLENGAEYNTEGRCINSKNIVCTSMVCQINAR